MACAITDGRAGAGGAMNTMYWSRVYLGTPQHVQQARHLVECLLVDSPLRDDAILVAGELIANAIAHTRSGQPTGAFGLELRRWPGGVSVTVIDQGGRKEPTSLPREQTLASLAENGRGLATVAEVASRWGWYGNQHSRTVFAELNLNGHQ